MGFEVNPIADCGSEPVFPAVEELISQLQSSFFAIEFQYAAKTLMEREQHIEQKYLKLLTKVEEEKSLLLSVNQKLNDELKKKQDEIDALRKLNVEYERKFRVCTKRSLDFRDKVLNLEKIAKESMGSGSPSIKLVNKNQNNRAAVCSRPSLFSEKVDSKKKGEPKLPEIVVIDDDDDDDDGKCISTLKGKLVTKEIKNEYNTDDDDDEDDDLEFMYTSKRRRVTKEIKREYNTDDNDDDDDNLEFMSTSKRRRVSNESKREHIGKPAKVSFELDNSASDSGSDSEIEKIYMLSIGNMKNKKKDRNHVVKDL